MANTNPVTDKGAALVMEWLTNRAGNIEQTAHWMAYRLRLGSIQECRDLIAQARTITQQPDPFARLVALGLATEVR